MSCFVTCEFCDKIGVNLCNCSSPPRFCCNDHILDHMSSNQEVSHPLEVALVKLSNEDIDLLNQAVQSYQTEAVQKAISQRNDAIHSLLQEIRRTEQECSSVIKNVLNGEMKQTVNQLVSAEFLPLYSSSSIVKTLVSLKKSNAFSLLNISNKISSLLSNDQEFSSIQETESIIQTNTKINSETVKKMKREKEKRTNKQWKLSHQIKAHTGIFYLGDYWGFDREITCIAVSECNRFFASASRDSTIKIWDARSYSLVRSLEGNKSLVFSVSFLGNKIVSGNSDNAIKIWEEDRCINSLSLHSDLVLSVCVSSSKRLIASGSKDTTIKVLDIENIRSLHTLRSHSQSVTSITFSADDREIISGSEDRSIKVWKTETGELLRTLYRHSKSVFCVRTSGKLIVSSSSDKSIKVGERDQEESSVSFIGHLDGVTSVDLCNKTVASISNDKSIRVWDLDSEKQVQSLKGHGYSSIGYIGYYHVGSLKILEEGRCIVSGGADGKIKVWRRKN